jgi:hypothetical protein
VDDMINKLVQKGLVNSLDNHSGLIYLDCLKDINQDGEIFYELKNKDFDNLGYIFDYYKGENKIKSCQECGSLFKQKANNQKNCLDCAKQIKQKQTNLCKQIKKEESRKPL